MLPGMDLFTSANRPPRSASSFTDQDAAENFVGELINGHAPEVLDWLSSGRPWLMVEDDFDVPTGRAANAMGVSDAHSVRVVLAKDAKMPDGFRVHTAYPQLRRDRRTDLPALRHLTGVYFHQDWDHDYGTYPRALATFLRDSPDLAGPLLDELDRLRALPEAELDRVFEDLGCEFTLTGGETWQGWVDDLARRVEHASQTTP